MLGGRGSSPSARAPIRRMRSRPSSASCARWTAALRSPTSRGWTGRCDARWQATASLRYCSARSPGSRWCWRRSVFSACSRTPWNSGRMSWGFAWHSARNGLTSCASWCARPCRWSGWGFSSVSSRRPGPRVYCGRCSTRSGRATRPHSSPSLCYSGWWGSSRRWCRRAAPRGSIRFSHCEPNEGWASRAWGPVLRTGPLLSHRLAGGLETHHARPPSWITGVPTHPRVFADSSLGGSMAHTTFARAPRAIRVLLFLTSLTWTSIAGAQAGTIAGTVIDAKSGLPIPDVSVVVPGATLAARTGSRGEFRLVNVPGATARLRFTRIGYRASTVDAQVGDPAVRVEMAEMSVQLDVVVVTGTAGEAQARSLGNSVGRLDVATTIALAGPPAKIQDVLSSSVPGVRIMRASGNIGSGGITRIRGTGSLSLSNEPLIYIDGVRSNNQAAVASYAFNGAQDSPSRINDLNPEEIESIEVLKGPSAATIYGTEASNGVIQIITKRGRAGRPTVEGHFDAGAAWLQDPENRYPANYYLHRGGDYRNP